MQIKRKKYWLLQMEKKVPINANEGKKLPINANEKKKVQLKANEGHINLMRTTVAMLHYQVKVTKVKKKINIK